MKKLMTLLTVGGILSAILPLAAVADDMPWTTEADGSWRSGTIGDDQYSSTNMFVQGPVAVSFRWKTSSESGCDVLAFEVDGSEINSVSGVMDDWERVTCAIRDEGEHDLSWIYRKDGSVSEGDDCGWVQDFSSGPFVEATITFDATGGSSDESSRAACKNFAIGTLPTPTKAGLAFSGWFTAATGGIKVTPETVVTGDMTLYAQWEEIVYTCGYIDNGDGTVTLSRWDENGNWIGGVSPSPIGEFTVPAVIDGNQVVAVAGNYFDDYYGLTSLVIPASVTNISCYALPWAYDLTNITVAAGNPAYKDIDGILYTKDGKTLVACPRAKGGAIAIAAGTENVGSYAFCNCYLTSISIPSGVKVIDDYAFDYCQDENFTSVTIPASVERIGHNAFGYCPYLANVTFFGDEAQIDIAASAFIRTPYDAAQPFELIVENEALVGFHGVAPENLVLSNHLDGTVLAGVGDYALSSRQYNTGSITNVVVPEGVTWIGYGSFAGDTALEGVTLPESLTSIGYGAFESCTALRTIRIPAGVSSIGGDPFWGCMNLTVYAPTNLCDTFSVPETCTIEYYEIPEYTVTFDANGGTVDGAATAETVVLQGHILEYLPEPYWEGYDFVGWFTENGTRASGDLVVTGDMTLTARWLAASPWYCETFHPDGDDGRLAVLITGAKDDSVVDNGVLAIPATLTALNDAGEEVELPVGGIEAYAFHDWLSIETLVLPTNVVWIGDCAFAWCRSLANVTFAGGRDSIDMNVGNAFFDTPWLDAQPFTFETQEEDGEVYLIGCYGSPMPDDTLVIPSGVTIMRSEALPYWGVDTELHGEGYRRFLGWYTAAEGGVRIDTDWRAPTRIVEIAGGTTLYARWEAAEPEWEFDIAEDGTATIIGNSVSLIGDVEIPASVTAEEEDEYGNVTEVSYPVTTIGACAFDGMDGITSVTIPASVTNIQDWAFEYCYGLTNVVFAGNMAGVKMRAVCAFAGTPWLDTYRSSLPEPDNDDFAGAEAISGVSGSVEGTTLNSSRETNDLIPDEYDDTCPATVWYRWVAPTNGTFVFSVADADPYYDWSCAIGATTGYDAENACWGDVSVDWGTLTIDATIGDEYWIEVGSYREGGYSEEFDFLLSWDMYAPPAEVVVDAGANTVTPNGNGYTITPPAGSELTAEDVGAVTVKTLVSGEWVYTTEGYDIMFGGGVITVSLKKPEVDGAVDSGLKDADDKSGFLVDPNRVPLATMPDLQAGETLGALPVDSVPGLWYQASWGASLTGMTSGGKVQAIGSKLYLGVVRQTGAAGFYKVSVSETGD